MKERDISLDLIRVLACFMVVLMHSPIPTDNANGPFLVVLSYLTAPCIGLFFMVSGALLLPVKTDYITFIRKRFSKIAFPTVFWTLIYVFLKIYHSESEINILQTMCSIPFSAQGSGVLWFMYTLAGLYLLAPILSAWLEKATKREIEIVLMLWSITLCYPLFENVLIVNQSDTGILYYFGGYAGYFLLGSYLKKYGCPKMLFWASISVASIGFAGLFISKRNGIEIDFYRMFWYLSIFIATLCVGIWKCVSNMKSRLKTNNCKNLVMISNLSFGIYLIHILIMREWLWKMDWINHFSPYSLQTIFIAIITFIISVALCYGITRLPYSQLLIGYKERKK